MQLNIFFSYTIIKIKNFKNERPRKMPLIYRYIFSNKIRLKIDPKIHKGKLQISCSFSP